MANFCSQFNKIKLFSSIILRDNYLINNTKALHTLRTILPKSIVIKGAEILCRQPQPQPPPGISLTSSSSIRQSSFRSSNPVEAIDEYPNVEVVKNAPEWQYVERLLGTADRRIPLPIEKQEYPSGWKPQQKMGSNSSTNNNSPYFIARSKNHMIPVYLSRSFRGTRHLTKLRKIQGNIWKLEVELKYMIEKRLQKKIATRINEMSGQISFKGDYVTLIQDYLQQKGF